MSERIKKIDAIRTELKRQKDALIAAINDLYNNGPEEELRTFEIDTLPVDQGLRTRLKESGVNTLYDLWRIHMGMTREPFNIFTSERNALELSRAGVKLSGI